MRGGTHSDLVGAAFSAVVALGYYGGVGPAAIYMIVK